MLVLPGSARLGKAQEPTSSIFSIARTAVRNQQLGKSEQLGFSISKTAYSDIPAEGGVLLGFYVQLGKFLDHEIVNGIKPIYATEDGNITTNEFGLFGNTPGKKKNADLTRVVRAIAPQGYAVGGITVRHGLCIEGLRLTFHRIQGNALDTKDAAISAWIGNNKAGNSEKTLGGNGAPIVGIFGNMDERRVLALGVYQLPAAVVALPAQVANPDDPPAAVNRQPEPEKLAVVPEKKPAEEAPAEPVGGIDNNAVGNEEPKAAAKAKGQDLSAWLPLGIFGCVGVIVFIGCLLAFGGKRGDPAITRRPPGAKKTPPTLAADLDEEPILDVLDATEVTEEVSHPSTTSSGAISAKPAAPAPGVPRLHDARAKAPAVVRTRPPYFHARAVYNFKPNRFYRVYVLPEMLLFLDAGPETNDQFTRGIGGAGAVTGGLLGGLIGQALGAAIDSTRVDGGAERKYLLDTADTDELIQLANEGGASFRAELADLGNPRIEPTSIWHTIQHFSKYVGLLCFHHPDRGNMVLEIPAANDMKTALAELPSVFGDDLAVHVMLDRRSWQYVAKKGDG